MRGMDRHIPRFPLLGIQPFHHRGNSTSLQAQYPSILSRTVSLLGLSRAALYLEAQKHPQPSLLMKIIYHSNSITGQDVLHV